MQQQQKNQLLAMTVQITEDKSDVINVYEGDDITILAQNFGQQYSLTPEIVEILIQKLKTNLDLNNNNVYDRLYDDFLQKQQQQQQEPSPVPARKSASTKHTDYLYKQFFVKEQKKQMLHQQSKQVREVEELSQCTHKPQININSKQIGRRSDEPISEYLYKQASMQQQRKQLQTTTKSEKNETDCTFKPQINQISQQIIESKQDRSGNLFEGLYKQAKEHELKLKLRQQQHFQSHYQFHPKIDEISNIITQGQDFYERQQKFLIQKQNLIKKDDKPNFQFRPQTGRPPQIQRESDVFSNLFELSRSKAQQNKQNQQMFELKQSEQSVVHASNHSSKLSQKTNMKQLKKLFQLLDSDGDNLISATRISVENLPNQKHQLLKPLIDEMRSGFHTLDETEFIDACNLLLNTLTVHEKHVLLN